MTTLEKLKKTNLLYWSVWLLVVACLILVSTKINFIFQPIGTFVSTIFTPGIIAGFLSSIRQKTPASMNDRAIAQ